MTTNYAQDANRHAQASQEALEQAKRDGAQTKWLARAQIHAQLATAYATLALFSARG